MAAGLESAAYLMQGISDFQGGQAQAKLLRQQGRQEIISANDDASQIRREGERIEGSNRAALAASGLDMGSASAQAIAMEGASEIERDVDLTLYRGRVRATELESEARMAKYRGKTSLINSSLKAYAAWERNAAGAVKGAAGGAP
jgi:hypothetical protein